MPQNLKSFLYSEGAPLGLFCCGISGYSAISTFRSEITRPISNPVGLFSLMAILMSPSILTTLTGHDRPCSLNSSEKEVIAGYLAATTISALFASTITKVDPKDLRLFNNNYAIYSRPDLKEAGAATACMLIIPMGIFFARALYKQAKASMASSEADQLDHIHEGLQNGI